MAEGGGPRPRPGSPLHGGEQWRAAGQGGRGRRPLRHSGGGRLARHQRSGQRCRARARRAGHRAERAPGPERGEAAAGLGNAAGRDLYDGDRGDLRASLLLGGRALFVGDRQAPPAAPDLVLVRSTGHLHGAAAGVMPDPAFFRAEDSSYCQDEVPKMDVARLAEELRALRGREYPFTIESHPDLSVEEMTRYYGEGEYTRQDKVTCTTMENYAFVDPRGRLYPCLTLDMGNVFEERFENVWNGRKFRAFRRLLRRTQRLPL